MLRLFDLFWSFWIVLDIVRKIDRYATEKNVEGNTMGSPNWENFTMLELKAFLANWLYMKMKQQPNIKNYWCKKGSIFHFPFFPRLIIWSYFITLTKYLHISNRTTHENFLIYCRKDQKTKYVPLVVRSESKLGHKVVLNFVEDMVDKSHVIFMDDVFSSTCFFRDLLLRSIYAIGTI